MGVLLNKFQANKQTNAIFVGTALQEKINNKKS
jgi:hypothetical protein